MSVKIEGDILSHTSTGDNYPDYMVRYLDARAIDTFVGPSGEQEIPAERIEAVCDRSNYKYEQFSGEQYTVDDWKIIIGQQDSYEPDEVETDITDKLLESFNCEVAEIQNIGMIDIKVQEKTTERVSI